MTYVETDIPQDQLAPNQRGQKEYRPMVTPLYETRKQLVAWKRPSFAYVLFEKKEWHIKEGGYKTIGHGLMTLNVEGRPEQAHQIDIYLNKGYRIIDYGNFPKLDDTSPSRAARARLYSHGAGINPWDSLEAHIKNVGMNFDPNIRQREEESAKRIAALEARVAQLTVEEAKKEEAKKEEAKKEDVTVRRQQRNTKADSVSSTPQE